MLIHDWKRFPVRFDTSRGYFLCEPCWNGQHYTEAFVDAYGVKRPKISNCLISKYDGRGQCECGCKAPKSKNKKFTGEGQTEISMEGAIEIK